MATVHIRSKSLVRAWQDTNEKNALFAPNDALSEITIDNMKKFSSGLLLVENGTSLAIPFPDIAVPMGVSIMSDQDITISVNGGAAFPCTRPEAGTDDKPTYARFFLEGAISSITVTKPDVDTGSLLDDADANVRYAVWGDPE